MASATTVTMIALNLILPQSGAVTGRPEKRNPLGQHFAESRRNRL
jgi:hypothetical protein